MKVRGAVWLLVVAACGKSAPGVPLGEGIELGGLQAKLVPVEGGHGVEVQGAVTPDDWETRRRVAVRVACRDGARRLVDRSYLSDLRNLFFAETPLGPHARCDLSFAAGKDAYYPGLAYGHLHCLDAAGLRAGRCDAPRPPGDGPLAVTKLRPTIETIQRKKENDRYRVRVGVEATSARDAEPQLEVRARCLVAGDEKEMTGGLLVPPLEPGDTGLASTTLGAGSSNELVVPPDQCHVVVSAGSEPLADACVRYPGRITPGRCD